MEPEAALALTWSRVSVEGENFKLDVVGRKKHKKAYFKIVGRDSIAQLALWRGRWTEDMGCQPAPGDLVFYGKRHGPMDPGWLNKAFKRTAARMYPGSDPDSWHIYSLRHSFSTECKHAKVDNEIREFFMGHVHGISWVYQHPDLHEEDFVREYEKVEPFVSINQSEIAIEERVKAEFDSRLESLERQMQEYLSRKLGGIA